MTTDERMSALAEATASARATALAELTAGQKRGHSSSAPRSG